MYLRIGAILLAILSLGATSAQGSQSLKQEKRPKPEVQVRGPILAISPMTDFDEQYYIEQEQIAAYLAAVEQQRQIDAYLAALEETRLANEEAARRASAAARVVASQPRNSGVTGVCGGATNGADQFISHESGGNPGVYNTQGSGAWGCYQIMPGTWASSCSDLGQHGSASPEQQAACASRLPMSAWGG